MDWRGQRRSDAAAPEAATYSKHLANEVNSLPPVRGTPQQGEMHRIHPHAMRNEAQRLVSQGARLPGMYSPMKAGYGSGGNILSRNRLRMAQEQNQHNHNLPELRSSLRPHMDMHDAPIPPETDVGLAILPETERNRSNRERSAIQAVQAREDVLQRVMQLAEKLDAKTESTMGYLSALNPTVKLFYRNVAMLRSRTIEVIETISAWQRTSYARSGRKRTFIWQGEDYLCKIGPDLGFLHEVASLSSRLPCVAPEATDPFLMTVTPDGVPIEEPMTIRVGSSRKGGEGLRIAMARRTLQSIRGKMRWEAMQPEPSLRFGPTHADPPAEPVSRQATQAPRTTSIRLAPLGTSPEPTSGEDWLSTPTMAPSRPLGGLDTAEELSRRMVNSAFFSQGIFPSMMPASTAGAEGEAPGRVGNADEWTERAAMNLPAGESIQEEEPRVRRILTYHDSCPFAEGGDVHPVSVRAAEASVIRETPSAVEDVLKKEAGKAAADDFEAKAGRLPASPAQRHVEAAELGLHAPQAESQSASARSAAARPVVLILTLNEEALRHAALVQKSSQKDSPGAKLPGLKYQGGSKSWPGPSATVIVDETSDRPVKLILSCSNPQSGVTQSASQALFMEEKPIPVTAVATLIVDKGAERPVKLIVSCSAAKRADAEAGTKATPVAAGNEEEPVVLAVEKTPPSIPVQDQKEALPMDAEPPRFVSATLIVLDDETIAAPAAPPGSTALEAGAVAKATGEALGSGLSPESPAHPQVDADRSTEVVGRLLDEAYRRQGKKPPVAVRAAALSAAAAQRNGGAAEVSKLFEEALKRHAQWGGAGSLATELVALLQGPSEVSVDCRAFGPSQADRLIASVVSSSGQDSLPAGRAAAQAGWLLFRNGHLQEAERLLKNACRVLRAWQGLGSGAAAACELMLAELGVAEAVPAEGVVSEPAMIDVDRAVGQAGILLRLAVDNLGGEGIPEELRLSLVDGVTRQVSRRPFDAGDEAAGGADVLLEKCANLSRSLLGHRSPATSAIRIIQGAGRRMVGRWASGFGPEKAEEAVAGAILASGQDSRAYGEACAEAAWLLHVGGHSHKASELAGEAARVMGAWGGPGSPVKLACQALVKLAGSTADPARTSDPDGGGGGVERVKQSSSTGTALSGDRDGESLEFASSTAYRMITEACRIDGMLGEVPIFVATSPWPALVLQWHGKLEDADKQFEEAIKLCSDQVGVNSCAAELVALMRSGAALLSGSTDMPFTPEKAQEAVDRMGEVDGPQSLGQGDAAASAAWLLLLERHFGKAKELAGRALGIKRAFLGPQHPAGKALELLFSESQRLSLARR